MSRTSINWKEQSQDLLQSYGGLVNSSLEGFNIDNYTFYALESEKKLLFTCVFTCPISGRHFPSGKLERSQAVQIDGSF